MIYVSSSCVKANKISEAIITLAEEGFRNIELSGGTNFYENYENDIVELKEKYKLNLLVHNYFPPPKENDFILNLASLNDDIYFKSINQLETGLALTRLLGGGKFGFHSGFFVDRPSTELGKKFKKDSLSDKDKATKRFYKAVNDLTSKFSDIELYIENNCYSQSNFQVYGNNSPFMLLSLRDYRELEQILKFKLLLDVGHLKVCSKTLGFDFNNDLKELFDISDYIHISDNDSNHDQSLGLTPESCLFRQLNKLYWKEKTITLEVYEGLDALKNTYSLVSSMENGKL